MTRRLILLGICALAAGLGLVAGPAGAKTTTTTVPATTLPIGTVPPTTGTGAASTGTGKILMVKMQVGNFEQASKFYNAVFGATEAMKVGQARIMTFPNGGPGLVLLGPGKKGKVVPSAFIIQVPNLDTARALALANGAKEQAKFSGNPGSQAAKSIDLLDPWGNQIEILQIG